jgi:scyllo-inositol 2-dehydrogenase (NADP+)
MNLNVALIGFGLSGRYFHAPFLKTTDGFTISQVMTRNAQSVHEFDADIEVVTDCDAIFENKDIDVVFVCSPNDTHFEYAQKALEAGKHVVIEKPFANSVLEAEKLIEIANRSELVLTAYQSRRWDADFLTIQNLLNQGVLGHINEFEARFDRFRPEVLHGTWKEIPKAGAGGFYNLGSHLIDQALVLFGNPDYVTATIKTIREAGITDDYFDVRLDYADKRVILKSNVLAYQNELRYVIHGSEGSFIKSGLDIQEDILRKNILPNTPDWGQEPDSQWGAVYSESQNGKVPSLAGNYRAFYSNLYDAIVHKKPLAVQPNQALNTTKVIELAFDSSRLKRSMAFS